MNRLHKFEIEWNRWRFKTRSFQCDQFVGHDTCFMIGLSWYIQMQSCLLQNTLAFWLLRQKSQRCSWWELTTQPIIFHKKFNTSPFARNLFIAYTQPHQPKWSQMYKKTSKWWDNPTTLNAGLGCLLSTSISPFFSEHVQGKETCRADQLTSTFGRPKYWEKDPFRDVWQGKC